MSAEFLPSWNGTDVPGEASFYAPVGYSVWWPLLGAALFLLMAGWFIWVWVSTRATASARIPGFVPPKHPQEVRSRYLALLSEIAARYDAGRIVSREAHLELSLALRTFVYEMTGLKTQRMTLSQLRAHRLPLVGDAVALLYPGEFAAQGGALSVPEAVGMAREVVSRWP